VLNKGYVWWEGGKGGAKGRRRRGKIFELDSGNFSVSTRSARKRVKKDSKGAIKEKGKKGESRGTAMEALLTTNIFSPTRGGREEEAHKTEKKKKGYVRRPSTVQQR